MSNRLMISVAAVALIAGAGLANAQGGMKNESGGAATQQSTPSGGGGAASGRESGGPSQMQSPSEQKSPGATKGQRAEEKTPGAAKGQRAEENAPGAKSKSMSSESETKSGSKDMKAETREGQNNNMKTEDREGQNNRSQMTTGQAGADAKLSGEQRTRITTVIRNEHVAPVNSVDFNVAVGTRIPRERVHLRPLPGEVVSIYPEWRGYEFILVHDQILVINPSTDEIVAILPA
jgi:hypothetical protein